MRRARLAAVLFGTLCGAACSRSLDVLAKAPLRAPDAAGARDAGAAKDLGEGAGSPCDLCGPAQLCAADHCVDALTMKSVSSGLVHSCEIDRGRLFCWGQNDNGELGLGDQAPHAQRNRVGSFDDWLRVSVGEHHSCAIRAPGRLYCWGLNSSGQLALGDSVPRLSPTESGFVDLLAQVGCGGANCCALRPDGALVCWGDNLEGKLGLDDAQGAPDGSMPTEVQSAMPWREFAVGQGHVCAIRQDQALYCWGRNTDLELGIGRAAPVQLRTPTRAGQDSDWQAIACSQHDSCGVRGNGALYCWGGNPFDELATTDASGSATPLRVGADSDWASVGAGWFHSCGQKRDGRVFCWGRAIEGQLGQGGGNDPLPTPTLVAMPARWQQITLANFFTCGIDSSNGLYCWGKNEESQLGLSDTARRFVPAAVP
jgi:alpha-tubulin suppressor-like RCC1 family protein